MKNKITKWVVSVTTAEKYQRSDIITEKGMHEVLTHSFSIFSLIAGIFCTIFFGTATYIVENDVLSFIIKYSFALILLVALINIWRKKNFYINGIIIPMIAYGILFCFLWFEGGNNDLRGIWIVLLPLLNILLGGCRTGIAFTTIEYLFIILVAMVDGFGNNYELSAFARYTGVYWVIALLAFIFELIRSKSEDSVEYLNRVIADKSNLENKEEHLERWLGIYNRSGFLALGDVIWKQAIRDKTCISFLMIDIDNFADLNKKYGHWACEDILKQMTDVILSNVRRPLDLTGRYRRNVYCVILYSADMKSTLAIAEKIRTEIYERKFEHKGFVDGMRASVSIGVAIRSVVTLESSFEMLIAQAANNLAVAQNKGRNCVYLDENGNYL